MKPIAKRDLAEVALVMVVVGFMIRAFGSLVLMLSWLAPWRQSLAESPFHSILFEAVANVVILVCMLGILWKRNAIVGRLFPDSGSEEGAFSVPEALADLAFWIRLFGVWIILSVGIQLVRYLFPIPDLFVELNKVNMILRGIPAAIATAVLGLVIIWQASAVARFVEWLARRGERQSAGSAPPTGD